MNDYAHDPFLKAKQDWESQAKGGSGDGDRVTTGLQPYVPFPLHLLPAKVRAYISNAAKSIGCDPAFIALPLLSAFASAIGNSRRLELKPGWTEPAIVWAVTIGYSGDGKSPGLDAAMAGMRRRQHDAMKSYGVEMETYRLAQARYEQSMTMWRSSRSSAEPPKKPQEPVPLELWTTDVTTEAVTVLLMHNPRGLLVSCDELATWFGSFNRYAAGGKGSDAARWIEMFHGRPVKHNRKTGQPRIIYVPRASVSVGGGIQPDTLRTSLQPEYRHNGLAARLLVAFPPRRAKQWTEVGIDPELEADVDAILQYLLNLAPAIDPDGDEQPDIVLMTPEAKTCWITFFNEHADEQSGLEGDLSAVWAKLEGYAARLALIIHLVRVAAGDPALNGNGRVDVASMVDAIALTRWFGAEARRVYAMLDESDGEGDLRRLMEFIARRGGPVSVRDVTHGMRKYRGRADAAERDLNALLKAGLAVPERGLRAGRPTDRVRLVGDVPVTETPKNQADNRGFGDGDGKEAPQ